MNFLKENFERLKNAGLKETFEALEAAFSKYEIDFYIIGARARDLWTDHLHLVKRTTEDVDFCIYIQEYGQFEKLIEDLITKHGFERDKTQPYRFYFQGTIDIIPFGKIEKDGEVKFENPPMELSVYGTKEAVSDAEIIEGGFKVVSLAGLCIMKLIAFNEKPDLRIKDLHDFTFLLRNYGEIAGNLLFEDAEYEDLIDKNFELQIAAAKILGRQINSLVAVSPKLLERVKQILQSRLQGFSYEEIDSMYAVSEQPDEQVELFKYVSEVLKELNGE